MIKDKTNSFINVFGLSVGITCSILIMLWVKDELTYDSFHQDADRIYRIVAEDEVAGKMQTTCAPLAVYINDNANGVSIAARYMHLDASAFKYENKILKIENGAFIDASFLKLFSFPFVQGNAATAFADYSNIVLTQKEANRFFGEENALGKIILIDGRTPLKVSGVIKDPPENSQFQFGFLLNIEVLPFIGAPLDQWYNFNLQTFVKTTENADIQRINSQIAGLIPSKLPGFNRKLYLQPLTDIHLNTDFPGERSGNIKYIYIFSSVALFLLLIACINYINLSTARILKRSKEVGLRKVIGSNRFQVIKQLLTETMIITFISVAIALLLIELLLPVFNGLSGKNLSVTYNDSLFIFKLLILIILISLLSGGYPALLLSSIRPISALNNLLRGGQKSSLFRKSLVVIQFSLSVLLIIGTTTVYQQLNYIKNKKLGFDKENILYFGAKGKFAQGYLALKNEMLNKSSIIDVTAEDMLLTNKSNSTLNLNWEGKEKTTELQIEYSFVDCNYFDLLNVGLEEGRKFSCGSDVEHCIILNHEAVAQMKIKNPIGKNLSINNYYGTIIGVIKNTNFKSLHNNTEPEAYMILNPSSVESFGNSGVILVKTAAGKTQEAIDEIKKLWENENPDIPFEFNFLDETIDHQYLKEINTAQIFGYFTFVAIFIACLGLYGLSMFMMENRTKEIGVRKVLGASVSSIVNLFYYDFVKLILIAIIIACPVANYLMNKWLDDFAYRINISWWIFAFSGGIALAIALATVSLQAIKAATANPVESLKYE
jgi:ABC-type antimicrobial peptide transport system permease subunit